MLPTRRLYETDPYQREFSAAVAACRPDENQPGCFETALDQTAFYPEGGGQPCDLGLLGGESVLAVRIDGVQLPLRGNRITSMLEKAFEMIPDGTGLILHSDQGWQYQHKKYQHMIRRKGIRQSMSRKGNCLDNAVMENFFGLLKSELLYLQKFDSLEHFKQELVDYLDYYNNRRIKIKLKGLPPAIHRQQALSVA